MGDRTSFEITSLFTAGMAAGITIMYLLGFGKGDLEAASFLMATAALFAVWKVEEHLKEIEKEMKRQ